MSRRNVRAWKLVLPLAALALGMTFLATSAFGASGGVVKVAVMTDCKGAFGGAYEVGAAGTNIALAQFAGGKVKNNEEAVRGDHRREGRWQDDPDRRLRVRRRHACDDPSRRRAG